MSGPSSSAIRLVAAVLLSISLVTIGVNIYQASAEPSKSVQTDIANTTTELQDQKYLNYDDTRVSGSQVVNALRKFASYAKDESIALYVETGKNTAGEWYYAKFSSDSVSTTGASPTITATQDPTDREYINPSGIFNATIERDDNGVIRAIKFVQEIN